MTALCVFLFVALLAVFPFTVGVVGVADTRRLATYCRIRVGFAKLPVIGARITENPDPSVEVVFGRRKSVLILNRNKQKKSSVIVKLLVNAFFELGIEELAVRIRTGVGFDWDKQCVFAAGARAFLVALYGAVRPICKRFRSRSQLSWEPGIFVRADVLIRLSVARLLIAVVKGFVVYERKKKGVKP